MKRMVVPLLFCLAVSGCLPAFLVELNSSAGLTAKMSAVATLGPVKTGGSGTTNVRFLPTKPTAASLNFASVQSGFTITSSGGNDYLQFLYVDSSGNAVVTNGQPITVPAADPSYPALQYEVTTTTTSANLVILSFATDTTFLYTATLPSGPLSNPPATGTLSTLFGNTALGADVTPQQSGAADMFNFLLWNGGSQFSEITQAVGGASVFPVGPPTANPLLVLPVSAAAQRYLYHRERTGTFAYASHFEGSGWVCYRWVPLSGAATILPGVNHRIDAVLTSGDLLSTEGGILRLYDPSGSLVTSVQLGGLQFSYETYLGTTAYVFFTLPINLHGNGWSFKVYAIPTSGMRGLGN